ncbi:MAG: adenylate/guanylate cyclase domain-containing protein [Deltaproteobacteria bacterium]|nr:adenylate/guanylate cyclase domain-containing protein [Deltaproteobacteria bacterium]
MATPRFPFQLKLMLLAGALGVVPTVAVGIGLIDVNARAVERESRALSIAVADGVVRTIEEEASRVEATLALAAHVLSDPEVPPDTRVALTPALVEGDSAIDHLAIYDARGGLIDVARGAGAGVVEVPEQMPAEVHEALGAVDLFVGRAVMAGGEPRVPFAMPIVVDGRRTGYVYTRARLVGVQARVERIHEAQFAGTEGVIYVVDEDLRLLAHPDAERAHALPSFDDREILRGVDPGALSPGVPRTGEVLVEGKEVLGTVVGLEARPWAVVVEVPVAVAYASLVEMRRLVILSTTVAAVLAFAFAFFLARRITAPIGSLVSFAGDLAHRRFDSRIALETGDELEVLAEAMSGAAAALEASEAQIGREAAIRTDLGRYLPEELVEKVVAREQDMALGGARREITVLFADVVAFTPLTERLGPEEVVSLLNELFTVMTELVFRHGGTVDKFVGDCVMAVFGAPTAQADHARRALDCAEDMMRWLSTANPGWEERYGATVQLAIGVHSGEAIVGNIGSERRMEYTAIGDVVNVAARLEAIARPMQILVSAATKDAVGDSHDFAEIGERVLSGRQDPVELWEVRS